MNTKNLVLAALSVVAGFSSPARGDAWLISSFSNTLYSYTQGSGAALNPRQISPSREGSVIGIDFSNAGVLYAVTTYLDNSLYLIDPITGAATFVGYIGLEVVEGDIGFDPTTNVLYGLDANSALYTIDLTTGLATIVGLVAPEADPSGLAFDNAGNLWVIANGGYQLVLLQVDKINGTVLSSQIMGGDVGRPWVLGADFNPITNQLYMATEAGWFYSVDTTTGFATVLDTRVVPDAAGLAFVPEPNTLLLLVFGAVAMIRRRRQ